MPTSKRPVTFPGSAPSPRAPFSEHHPFPITFFLVGPENPSITGLFCPPGAQEPAPPLTTRPPHPRHFYAASPHQTEPPRLGGCKPGPSLRPRSPARQSGRRRPRPSSAQTIRAETGGRPRLRAAQGGGGGGAGRRVSPPAACRPGSRSRGPGQARRGPQPASPARRRCLSPRLRGSGLAFPLAVQRCLRRRRALLTRSSTTPDRLLKSGRVVAPSPTRTSRCDWLARSLFSTSCPDWPVLSLAPPYREDTSTPPPRLALPPPQPRFHLGGLGAGAGAGGTRTANGSAERGPGGGLCRRPAQAGKFSQWARAPHPGLRSASLAASVPAGRAQGHTRLAVARERYPLEGWENAARPVRESAGGHCGVLPHRLRGVCERGVVARWWTPGTSARCFVGSEQSVRLVQPRGPNQAAVQNFPLLEQMTTDKSQRMDFAILSFYLHLQEDFSFVGELHDLFSFTNWLPVIAQKCRSLTLKLLSTHGNKIVCMFNSHICISSPCQWTSRKNTVKVLTASLLEGCQ
ncbi:translation initiation factor IF-2-like [Panthera leo]|uniref:translation initiation factor IF-2-like n=1 Tax=Panthera leo TaxID=9689 RepID=UPI001C69FA23|nr:translation initiation factor IF-2-like [Panthera leo]